jgi:small-conductance mechanosensitive channel
VLAPLRLVIAGVVPPENFPAPPFVEAHFPGLAQPWVLGVAGWQWIAMAGALVGALLIGVALSRVFLLISKVVDGRPTTSWLVSLGQAVQTPLTGLLALGAFNAAVHAIDLTGRVSDSVDGASRLLLIAGLAWLIIDASGSVTRSIERKLSGEDEFQSRGIRTQLLVALRAFNVLVVIGALAAILSGFHAARSVGVSLLASAGIASVVIGIAAQKTIGSFLAGILLSVSQQVRLGDTVVVETEFCTVEEIRLTYVVLKTWDLRRLVVPVNKFLDSTFQNWTRVRTHLLGTAELWVDFNTPLAPPREELARICRESKLWDQRVCSLQVTDASDKAMKLRLLVSADNAGNLFDLRCEVREKMIAFLNRLDGGIHMPFSRNANMPDAWVKPAAPVSPVALAAPVAPAPPAPAAPVAPAPLPEP